MRRMVRSAFWLATILTVLTACASAPELERTERPPAQASSARTLSGGEVEALIQRADSLYAAHRLDEAVLAYEQVLQRKPSAYEVFFNLTENYAHLGLFERAEQRARELYLGAPDNRGIRPPERAIEYHCIQGYNATLQGKREAAIAHVDSMVALAEDADQMLPGCAFWTEVPWGSYERAAEHVEQVLATTSGQTYAKFLPWAAYVAQKRGNEERARMLLGQAEAARQSAAEAGLSGFMFDYWTAALRAVQGDGTATVQYLRQAYEKGYRRYYRMNVEPMFSSLQGHPEFESLAAEMEADVARMGERVAQAERLNPASDSADK